jgi:hypothetical protein
MNCLLKANVRNFLYSNLIYCFHAQCFKRICIIQYWYFIQFLPVLARTSSNLLHAWTPVAVHILVAHSRNCVCPSAFRRTLASSQITDSLCFCHFHTEVRQNRMCILPPFFKFEEKSSTKSVGYYECGQQKTDRKPHFPKQNITTFCTGIIM